MLQNAYLIAKIGADTPENEQHFAENLPNFFKNWQLPYGSPSPPSPPSLADAAAAEGALRWWAGAWLGAGAAVRSGMDGIH